jgi:bifunctional non-homologous end joining protein LigD
METTLYYRQGSSDKIYQARIAPEGNGYLVLFAYGRRGTTLQTGTKTQTPVAHDEAKKIYDKLITEKIAKGYTPGADGVPYQHTEKAQQASGIQCQLLNPIDEIEVQRCIRDPDFWLQEKHDGRRLLIRKEGAEVVGINRLGLIVGIPETLATACQILAEDYVIDGEAIGDDLFAFDILSLNGVDLREQSYLERYMALKKLITTTSGLIAVESACSREEKAGFFEFLKRGGREGAVFKRISAPYTAGRPANGGDQLKHKFYETASFIVGKANGKRSVSLKVFDSTDLVPAGNVTIPPNQAVPEPGAVVEVRYLYAFKESGSIFQPVYLGTRDDIQAEQCSVRQLKFKAEAEAAA